jgi:SAM-dependent methyltransferase
MSGRIFEQLHFGTREICPVCLGESIKLGDKRGRYIHHDFSLRECIKCTYAFIENPCVDFGHIYDENYYRAKGADPLTDYMFELEHPDATIRTHELEGIADIVRSITGSLAGKSWLDFGCGNGALVRHLCAAAPGAKLIAGFEEGWIAAEARRRHINVLSASELDGLDGTFDVVSAVEVLEHVLNPVETLSRIRKLLKPGGLFFYTTGNSSPFRKNLLAWPYVLPEIHVGFFNPRSMSVALEKAAFDAQHGLYRPGYEKIIRFKVLKNLGVRRDSAFFNLIPWSIVSRTIDMKYQLSRLPTAFAR